MIKLCSYCELTAHFAVEVYGSPLSVVLQLIIVGAIVGGFLLVLFVSYFVHKLSQQKQKIA